MLFFAWCENHLCYKEWKKTQTKNPSLCVRKEAVQNTSIFAITVAAAAMWAVRDKGCFSMDPIPLLPTLLHPHYGDTHSSSFLCSSLLCISHPSMHPAMATQQSSLLVTFPKHQLSKRHRNPPTAGWCGLAEWLILPVWICPPWSHVTLRNWTLLRAHDIDQIWFKLTKGFKGIRAQKHRLMAEGVIAWDYCLRKTGLKNHQRTKVTLEAQGRLRGLS